MSEPSPNAKPIVVDAPWLPRSAVGSTASSSVPVTSDKPATFVSDGGRPCVVVPASVMRVWTDASPDDLPCIGSWCDVDGTDWKRFELPMSDIAADATNGECVELCQVFWAPRLPEDVDCMVELRRQLPRLARTASDDRQTEVANGSISMQSPAVVEDLIDRHIDLVNHLFEVVPKAVKQSGSWQGNLGGVAIRRIADVVKQWCVVGQADEPRMALIVKLANKLPDILAKTCRHPRHTLRRVRQFSPLGRVREVDSACLRWLARQPGATVAQKAGMKQRVLSVVRVEDIDTPENRVVRDLLIRATQACNRYLREYHTSRVENVEQFRRLLRELLTTTAMADVQPLVGIPQPNYVLQMDPRYAVLWDAWQQLVRQQMLEDSVWRWRQRLFAEHLQFGLVAVLHELSDTTRTHGGDVLLQLEQNAGQFLDPRTALGPWWLKTTTPLDRIIRIDLVRGDQLARHPLIPKHLAELCPDIVLVKQVANETPWLAAFWTMLDFDIEQSRLDDRVISLSEASTRLGSQGPLRGVIIQPALSASGNGGNQIAELDNCHGLRLPLPLSLGFAAFRDQVSWALGMT